MSMHKLSDIPTDAELAEKLACARAIWDALSPSERVAVMEVKRQSRARGQIGLGSDADEARARAAHRQNLAGATDAAKALAERVRILLPAPHAEPPVAIVERYGTTLDARTADGRRFLIIVAELPS